MPVPPNLTLFVLAALALLVLPGPAVIYIVTRSVDQGRLAGVVSALGINTGDSVHVVAAVLGLSALLMSSALAFNVVKVLGAAYLIYLGVRKLFFEKDEPQEAGEPQQPQKLSRIYTQGVVVAVLNPKTALFFFAFLPQFVDPARGAVAGQILLLGFLRGQRTFAGGIYIALGVATAVSGADHR
jgi:threonine/homoserine/homoserine lactone efflux protein